MPFRVYFIKHNGKWKIYFLYKIFKHACSRTFHNVLLSKRKILLNAAHDSVLWGKWGCGTNQNAHFQNVIL